MNDEILLKLDGITKVFPGTKALDNVQLEIRKGEVHALIGENGAGKSTLMKIILGIYHAESGIVTFKGKQVHFNGPIDALKSGISMIHQEISLVPMMDVAENIWLGRENTFIKHGILDLHTRYKKTDELLKGLGIDHINPHATVDSLSVANMQLVEIARAVSYNSDLIIMDEPTSALTSVEVELLYKIIRGLSAQGVSIIFISHRLEEIFKICDRVTVFRDGCYIITKNCNDITQDDLITYIVGRQLTNLFPKLPAEIKDVVLEVKNLCCPGVFSDVSFNVRAGEILGFSGLVGAGRTEIMSAIFGINRYTSGEIYVEGKKVDIHCPLDAVKAGLGMVTEDRLREGAIHGLSVLDNAILPSIDEVCGRSGVYTPNKALSFFIPIKDRIKIKCNSPMEAMGELSGGNQQKVIIARWLLTNPKILILDEPTRGIDVGSKSEIHRLISELAQQGMAIIMISSELPEILGMSDRIEVVRGGKIVYECTCKGATQELLMQHAFGTQSK